MQLYFYWLAPKRLETEAGSWGDTEGHTRIAGVGLGQARTDAQQTQVAGKVKMEMNTGALRLGGLGRGEASLPAGAGRGGFLGKDCGVGEGRAAWKGQGSGSLPPSWVLVSEQSQNF